jgi:hypothetical protein
MLRRPFSAAASAAVAPRTAVQRRSYFLAFNAAAKARPNFGLKGVGWLSSTTYHNEWGTFWSFVAAGAPIASVWVLIYNGIWGFVDEIAGDGPRHVTMKELGQNTHADKPWEFVFSPGEGYANGPAKYRPEPGAIPLHH